MNFNRNLKVSQKQRKWLDFLLAMTKKEIKVRYKHATLGFLWIIINPLLQMLAMGLVFQFFVPVEVDNYFLFLFTGLLPWNFFSLSLSKTTPAIVNERALIQKANFPREIIVLSIVLSNMFHFLVSLSILTIVLIGDKIILEAYGISELFLYTFNFLKLFPLLIWLFILTSSLSFLTSSMNVKYRDVNFFVGAILPIWFYLTPIVYTIQILPEFLQLFFYLNPVTAIIENFHNVLLRDMPISHPNMMFFSLVLTVFLGIFSWNFFKKRSKFFDDWI